MSTSTNWDLLYSPHTDDDVSAKSVPDAQQSADNEDKHVDDIIESKTEFQVSHNDADFTSTLHRIVSNATVVTRYTPTYLIECTTQPLAYLHSHNVQDYNVSYRYC